MQAFYQELLQILKTKKLSQEEFAKYKKDLCKKHSVKKIPSNIQILLNAKKEDLKDIKIITKPIRSISGVSVVAVMSAPFPCPHGKCTFCPGGPGSYYGDVPQSYTGKEPSTMRGIRNNYDAYLQVFNRLEQYVAIGRVPDKVELIIMGGTFPSYDINYQNSFVRDCYMAMNDFGKLFFPKGEFDFDAYKEFFEMPGEFENKERVERIKKKLVLMKKELSLEEVKKENETAKIRCVGLTEETKPDWAFLEHGNTMLNHGCTRVELGVQTVYDEVLKKTNRGHDLKDTIKSIRILKDLGFKINAHLMPGLPDVTKEKDVEGLKEIFKNPDFRPDMLKIYPCMVAPGTALYAFYKAGKFKPLTTDEAAQIIAEFKPSIPEYCRVQRINRDVPTKQWAAGVGLTNLRQYMDQKYKPKCRCIRCREPKDHEINWKKVELVVREYEASKGKEFFISYEDTSQDIILGFCRLRFPSTSLRPEITDSSALIREVHVYGQAIEIGKEGEEVQHKGLGKKLVKKAEEITKENGKNKIVIISGVGVREYYKKLGYQNDGPYVSKNL